MTEKANDRQVGGDHYKSEYQHWDFVPDVGVNYLLGTASKYVTRWRKKNGIQDLEKAIHYIDKFCEHYEPFRPKINQVPSECFWRLVEANKIDMVEARIIWYLSFHINVEQLHLAKKLIEELIKTVPKETPRTDSNKHAGEIDVYTLLANKTGKSRKEIKELVISSIYGKYPDLLERSKMERVELDAG